jgi:hypothetical protein
MFCFRYNGAIFDRVMALDFEMAKIPKSDQSQNTSRKYKSEK